LSANTSYNIRYKRNNVTVNLTGLSSNGSGCITVGNLQAGNYADILATDPVKNCSTNPVGSFTLTAPEPALISMVSKVEPSTCVSHVRQIVISGLTSGIDYTLTYTLNGSTSGSVSFTTSSSNYALINLQHGTYGIHVVSNGCTSNTINV